MANNKKNNYVLYVFKCLSRTYRFEFYSFYLAGNCRRVVVSNSGEQICYRSLIYIIYHRFSIE